MLYTCFGSSLANHYFPLFLISFQCTDFSTRADGIPGNLTLYQYIMFFRFSDKTSICISRFQFWYILSSMITIVLSKNMSFVFYVLTCSLVLPVLIFCFCYLFFIWLLLCMCSLLCRKSACSPISIFFPSSRRASFPYPVTMLSTCLFRLHVTCSCSYNSLSCISVISRSWLRQKCVDVLWQSVSIPEVPSCYFSSSLNILLLKH